MKNFITASLPDLSLFYDCAFRAMNTLPENFRLPAENLMIRVENFADHQTLTELNITDKYDLLGLYRGIPLTLKHSTPNVHLKDSIFLYRCPLIRYARENNEQLEELIAQVMYHEMSHHFGQSNLDYWLKNGR